MTLEEIRIKINKIDTQILEKLNQRMYLSLQTRKFKTKIKDSNRESQVLDQIKHKAKGFDFVRKKFAEKIFKKIIHESRRIQKIKHMEEP